MGTAIVCIVIALVCVYGVFALRRKTTSGCCGSGGETVKRIKPADRHIENYPYAYRLVIRGMTCQNCAKRVENAFNASEGLFAKADFSSGNATVHAKRELSEEELRGIVGKAGYSLVSSQTLPTS